MNVKHQWQYLVRATGLISLSVSLQIQFYFLCIPLETKLQNNWGGDREHWATAEAIFSLDTVYRKGIGIPILQCAPFLTLSPFSGCVNPVNSTSPKPHLWLYYLETWHQNEGLHSRVKWSKICPSCL